MKNRNTRLIMSTIAEEIVKNYDEQKMGFQYYHETIELIRKDI